MGRAQGAPLGRRRPRIGARRWRAFVALVVVPVLLMLGSIYTHAAATGISGKVAGLEQEREMAEVRQENLDLRLTALTSPERIRSKAKDLGLRDPVGSLKVYGSQGEDGTNAAGQTGEEKGR
jgi:cell division protein FtsL